MNIARIGPEQFRISVQLNQAIAIGRVPGPVVNGQQLAVGKGMTPEPMNRSIGQRIWDVYRARKGLGKRQSPLMDDAALHINEFGPRCCRTRDQREAIESAVGTID